MISSTPQPAPQLPPVDSDLYQMTCDLSELAGAGWVMALSPGTEEETAFFSPVNFRFTRCWTSPDSEITVYGFTLNRFALAVEMPHAIHQFHQLVTRAMLPDDSGDVGDIPDREL